MGVLGDAVFMALAGIDAGGAEAIVVQQGGVIVVKSRIASTKPLPNAIGCLK